MASYHFVDHWQFDASLDAVWSEIADPLDWPAWWPSMTGVEEIEPGDAQGLGALRRYTVKGALPYRVSFDMRTTVIKTGQRIEGEASGDVQGHGCWTFSADDKKTHVRYDWSVETTKRWMILLAPLMGPLIAWNHHAVMRRGQVGLAARLRARN